MAGDARGGVGGSAGEDAIWEVALAEEGASEDLGRFLADLLRPGDRVLLSGGLGAGKTTLARAIVRELAGDPDLEVPSPTFTLLQPYDAPGRAEGGIASVVHADLYRLRGPDELVELGWDEMTEEAVTLVEWPDRLPAREIGPGSSRPALRVDLALAPELGPEGRIARMSAGAAGDMAGRLARARALRGLLARTSWADAERRLIQGDASTRAYERLTRPEGSPPPATAILMIAPRRPDGPPVRRGKPYSAIAKLAESVHPFVAVDRGLRALGLSAPRLYGEDLEAGLLLLEDLGGEPVVTPDRVPIPERYAEAVRLLAKLHATDLPGVLPVEDGRDHVVPPYDLEALMIEVELVADWYAPHVAGLRLSSSARNAFLGLWLEVLREVATGPAAGPERPTWVLRDYHSPNLIWLPDRGGIERVGLIDFQDAVLGHPAYDVASLLQDARVDAPAELELRLLGLYVRERRASDPAFDLEVFARAYAILAAQRATKILGIFARLDRRDGKPHYLAHLPRIEGYLARDLAHPALARLRGWYEAHLPRVAALLPSKGEPA